MKDTSKKETPAWVERFLAALREGTPPAEASRRLGLDSSAPYHRRRSDPAFRAAWAAIRPFGTRKVDRDAPRRSYGAGKFDRFLTVLGETSNVSHAAAVADVPVGRVYKLRRQDPAFARRWYAALAEGYDNLEMELLGRLRAGEGGETAKDAKKFDTAAALRCLAAHRDSVAREKGRRALAEEVATIASLNDKIDKLRLNAEAGAKAIAAARKEKARRSSRSGSEAGAKRQPVGPQKPRLKKGPGDA